MTINQEQQVTPAISATSAALRTRARPFLLRRIRQYSLIFAAMVIVLLLFTWMVTHGTWRVFDVENFGLFYDAQARSLLEGRLDVPAKAIQPEAFINKGKIYGYFGIAPALLRVPLVLLFALPDGSWSRFFMISACLINLVCTYLLLQQLRQAYGIEENRRTRLIAALIILLVGVGSSNIFMASRAFVYHEAIMLASSFALAYYYCLLRYFQTFKTSKLIIASIWCFLAFLTRATSGAGALLAHALLTVLLLAILLTNQRSSSLSSITTQIAALAGVSRTGVRWRHALIALGSCMGTLAFFFAVNYAKFDTFDGVPVTLYSQYLNHPTRLKITGGRQIHLENLRTGLYSYFSPRNILFKDSFPWVYMRAGRKYIFPESVIDVIEPSSSISASMPALFILTIAGFYSICTSSSTIIHKLRLPLLGASAGGSVILLTVGLTQRYLHDFFPMLIIGSAVGAYTFLFLPHRRLRRASYVALVLAFLFSVYTNVVFAIEYQRELVWGVEPEPRAAFSALRSKIDDLFSPLPIPVLYSSEKRPPAVARPGQLWIQTQGAGIAQYTGTGWQTLRDNPPYGPRHIKVAFAQHPGEPNEPLLVTGVAGQSDFVYVHYVSETSIAFGLEHSRVGGPRSLPISIVPGRLYDLTINLDRLCKCIVIQFDHQTVLNHIVDIYPATVEQVELGENRIGGVGPGTHFSGVLVPLTAESLYEGQSLNVQASSYSDDYRPEHAIDNDTNTVWAAKGSAPATFTITPARPGIAKSLLLIARQTSLYESWFNVEVRRYWRGTLISTQTFFMPNAATQRVLELPLQPTQTDRIELYFSQPVTTLFSGGVVDASQVNPGYAEILVDWQ